MAERGGKNTVDQREFPPSEELVRELSQAALMAFDADYPGKNGKFIRIGRLIFVAPDARFQGNSVTHHTLYQFVHSGPDEKLKATVGSALERNGDKISLYGLNDAGWYTAIITDGFIAEVELSGHSKAFGRADAAGRERTSDIFHSYLGDEVVVIAYEDS